MDRGHVAQRRVAAQQPVPPLRRLVAQPHARGGPADARVAVQTLRDTRDDVQAAVSRTSSASSSACGNAQPESRSSNRDATIGCALRVGDRLPDLVAQAVARLPRPLRRHAAQLPAEDAIDDVGAGELGLPVGADQRARAQLRQRNRQVVDVRHFVARDARDDVRRALRIGAHFRVAQQLLRPVERVFGERLDDEHVRHHDDHVLHPLGQRREHAARVRPPRHPSSGAAVRRRARAASPGPGRAPLPTSVCDRPRCDARLRRARAPRTVRWRGAQPRCLRSTPSAPTRNPERAPRGCARRNLRRWR